MSAYSQINGEFIDFPDFKHNKKRILYSVWHLNLMENDQLIHIFLKETCLP